jgi:CheY-specific phosphatase CheX
MNDTLDPARARDALAKCVTSVFADLAFLDVQVAEADRIIDTKDMRISAIAVLMPLSCRIKLKIPGSLRDRIADTLFSGIEGNAANLRKNADDSILEILNIVAGAFLSAYFGQGTEIRLELPEYLYADDDEGQTVTRIAMDAEGETLEVSLSSVRYRY